MNSNHSIAFSFSAAAPQRPQFPSPQLAFTPNLLPLPVLSQRAFMRAWAARRAARVAAARTVVGL